MTRRDLVTLIGRQIDRGILAGLRSYTREVIRRDALDLLAGDIVAIARGVTVDDEPATSHLAYLGEVSCSDHPDGTSRWEPILAVIKGMNHNLVQCRLCGRVAQAAEPFCYAKQYQ